MQSTLVVAEILKETNLPPPWVERQRVFVYVSVQVHSRWAHHDTPSRRNRIACANATKTQHKIEHHAICWREHFLMQRTRDATACAGWYSWCVPLISTSCRAFRKIPGTMFASLTISMMTFRDTENRGVSFSALAGFREQHFSSERHPRAWQFALYYCV